MKPTDFSTLALLVPLLFAQQEPRSGALERVAPGQEQDQVDDPAEVFARDFDRDQWRERLGVADLERREQNFDALVRRAALDPLARTFLEDLAHDSKNGELAWTARLALRELGRPRFALGHPAFDFFSTDPFGRSGKLEEMLRGLSRDGLFPPGVAQGPSGGQGGGQGGRGSSSSRSVHVEQTDQGARVVVTEDVDGQKQERVYEGKDLDEILAANPELKKDLGGLHIRGPRGSPFDFDLDLGLPEARHPRDPFETLPWLDEPQKPTRPVRMDKLGVIVQPLTPEHAAELGLEPGEGLFVERSATGTFAHLLGIGTGDVLIAIDGQRLQTLEDVGRIMQARDPKSPLSVTWIDELGQRHEKTWQPDSGTPTEPKK